MEKDLIIELIDIMKEMHRNNVTIFIVLFIWSFMNTAFHFIKEPKKKKAKKP